MAYEEYIFIPNSQHYTPSKAFQSACSFIALAAESRYPNEVAVLEGNEAAAAADLAKALGAMNVPSFPAVGK